MIAPSATHQLKFRTQQTFRKGTSLTWRQPHLFERFGEMGWPWDRLHLWPRRLRFPRQQPDTD